MQAKQLFQFLKAGEALTLRKAKRMTGVDVYLSGLRLEDGGLLIVAADKACPNAIAIYAKRWEIGIYQPCCLRKSVYKTLMNFIDGLMYPDTLSAPLLA